jgi:hypothetical protein
MGNITFTRKRERGNIRKSAAFHLFSRPGTATVLWQFQGDGVAARCVKRIRGFATQWTMLYDGG